MPKGISGLEAHSTENPALFLEVLVNWFRLKACAKCQDDLVFDDGDWLCLQCGTYWYTGLYRNQEIRRWPQEDRPAPRIEKTQVLAQSTPDASTVGRAPMLPLRMHLL